MLSIQQNPKELEKLRNAFRSSMQVSLRKMADNRGYQYIAGFHGVPGFHCWHHLESIRTTLRGRLFLPWHRAYLHHLETNLRDILEDPTITIPYWDWRFPKLEPGEPVDDRYDKDSELPKAYSEQSDENGQPNPLYASEMSLLNKKTLRERNPKLRRPTEQEITDICSISNFDEFEYELEQVHDRIHGFVGGSMAAVGEAAFDPIFWAHHSMIDRIWYLWQNSKIGGSTKGFEQLTNAPLAPFNLTVGEVLDTKNLGYQYAGDKTTVSVKAKEEF